MSIISDARLLNRDSASAKLMHVCLSQFHGKGENHL